MTTSNTVVYRVETKRLILRCWSPENAPLWRMGDNAIDKFSNLRDNMSAGLVRVFMAVMRRAD